MKKSIIFGLFGVVLALSTSGCYARAGFRVSTPVVYVDSPPPAVVVTTQPPPVVVVQPRPVPPPHCHTCNVPPRPQPCHHGRGYCR